MTRNNDEYNTTWTGKREDETKTKTRKSSNATETRT